MGAGSLDGCVLPQRRAAGLSRHCKPRQGCNRGGVASTSGREHTAVQVRALADRAQLQQQLSKLTGAAAAAVLLISSPAFADNVGFLGATGGKGPLAEEEERLIRLRLQKEGEAVTELLRQKNLFEAEASKTQNGKLCATPFGVDVVGITEFIALTGALVGGFSARQRKKELEKLNERLRTINMGLRQQARAGTVYAPGLTYAPPSTGNSQPLPFTQQTQEPAAGPMASAAVALQSPPASLEGIRPPLEWQQDSALQDAAATGPSQASVMGSMDEDDMTPEARQCLMALREGKRMLKERNGSSAMVRFEKALMLAKATHDMVQQRRAVRGLAAAARLGGQHKAAISHLKTVLKLSRQMNDHVGDADAYGTIADIYTDMGEFEAAAEYYDRYISQMNAEGPV